MNKARRKNLASLSEEIETLRSLVESVMEEEQEAFDNLPEGIQYSERGERMEEIISYIEYAVSNLEEACENLQEAIDF